MPGCGPSLVLGGNPGALPATVFCGLEPVLPDCHRVFRSLGLSQSLEDAERTAQLGRWVISL